MTMREHLVDDSPSVELTIYGADETDESIDDLRTQRPDVKVSLSNDVSLETLANDSQKDGAPKKASMHVIGKDTEENAVTKATDDALKSPENTTVVIPDKDTNSEKLKESFSKFGAKVSPTVEAAVEHLKERL